MKFGIDRLRDEPALRKPLAGRRVALLAHPASVDRELVLYPGAILDGFRRSRYGPEIEPFVSFRRLQDSGL